MGDGGEAVIPRDHVKELADFFAAHDRWLFGHACVRTHGARRKLVAGLERYYPFGSDRQEGSMS